MANDLSLINGITRINVDDNTFYYVLAPYWIKADLSKDIYDVLSVASTINTVSFDSITDKLGAANIVAYLDAAITGGYFQSLTVSGGGGVPANISTLAEQQTQTARLNSILAKIIAAPSTEAKQDTLIASLVNWENNGIPLRSELGNAFGLSKGSDLTLDNVNNGVDTLAYLFRVKAGVPMALLRSFFISIQSNSNDRYEARLSANPTFSNYTIDDSHFQNVTDPTNPLQSNLQFARAGEQGVPALPVINGYNEAVGGRLMLPKYGENQETMDSRTGFQVVLPQGSYFALSFLPSSNNADVRVSLNWNE